jgi:hypothetical protein
MLTHEKWSLIALVVYFIGTIFLLTKHDPTLMFIFALWSMLQAIYYKIEG